MKELLRITYSLARPSKVGVFNKDNIIIPILHMLVLFIGLCVTLCLIVFNTTYFGKSTADSIVEYLGNAKFNNAINLEDDKIYYDSTTHKFVCEYENGKNYSSKNSGIYMYFFIDDSTTKVIPQDYIVMDFHEEYVSLYYNTIFTKNEAKFYYKDSFSNSFDLSKAASGDISNFLEASNLFKEALSLINVNYQIYDAVLNCGQALLFYILVFVFLIIVSSFTNPQIDMKVRLKLVMYDSLPYPFLMILTFMFNFSYLQYVALFLPFLYTVITFKHILKIKKTR